MIGPRWLVEPLGTLGTHRFTHQRLGEAHKRFPFPEFLEKRIHHVLHLLERLGRLAILKESIRIRQRGDDLGDVPIEFTNQFVETRAAIEATDHDKSIPQVVISVLRVIVHSRRCRNGRCIVCHETSRLKNSCRS